MTKVKFRISSAKRVQFVQRLFFTIEFALNGLIFLFLFIYHHQPLVEQVVWLAEHSLFARKVTKAINSRLIKKNYYTNFHYIMR